MCHHSIIRVVVEEQASCHAHVRTACLLPTSMQGKGAHSQRIGRAQSLLERAQPSGCALSAMQAQALSVCGEWPHLSIHTPSAQPCSRPRYPLAHGPPTALARCACTLLLALASRRLQRPQSTQGPGLASRQAPVPVALLCGLKNLAAMS